MKVRRHTRWISSRRDNIPKAPEYMEIVASLKNQATSLVTAEAKKMRSLEQRGVRVKFRRTL